MNATVGGTSGRAISLFGESIRPAALGLLVAVSVFVVMYWSSFDWMASEWSESSGLLSHGYLVAAIAAYLIVRSSRDLAGANIKPVWWLLPFLLGMSIVWLLAYVANVAAVQTMILPVMLLVAITAVFGVAAGKLTSFGVLYMYFSMPAWHHIQFVFQEITVFAVHALIRIAGIPAYVSGSFVYIPNGTFEIEGGCSGLSFLLAGLSLAVLYGHLYYENWAQKLRLVALTVVVSMIGNWIRVFGVVIVGYFKGMQSELVSDHLFLGWVIFSLLMVPVFFVARRLESDDVESAGTLPTQPAELRNGGKAPWIAASIAILLAGVGPAWARIVVPAVGGSHTVTVALPQNVAGWLGPKTSAWNWQPRFAGVTDERMAEYRRNNKVVLTYANVYTAQEQGRELIYHKNTIFGDWRTDAVAAAGNTIFVEKAGTFQVDLAASPYGSWIILHRYIIGGEPVVGDVRGKIRQSLASLQGRSEAGVIAFAIPCSTSCDDSIGDLTDFVSAVGESATVSIKIEDR